jgi:hypothetical protein
LEELEGQQGRRNKSQSKRRRRDHQGAKGSPKLVWWRWSVAMDGEDDVYALTNGRRRVKKGVVVVCLICGDGES